MALKNIWLEELRPKTLDEVIGNPVAIEILKRYLKEGNIPHLLFSGNPGIGKTTIALALAHGLYGESYRSHFREFNASDEGRIEDIRTTVKDLAEKSNDKIIFLDEADALSKGGNSGAQTALRRIIEKYSDRTRFILSCNYRGNIIEPIQSRLTPIHFRPLNNAEMNTLIDRVCAKKSIVVPPEVREILFRYAKGDARRIINPLESSSMLGTNISKEVVQVFTQTPDLETAKLIVTTALSSDFISAHEILIDMFINKGFDHDLICETLIDACKTIQYTTDKNKNNRIIATINAIVANHTCHMMTSNPYVEFSGMLAKISMIQSINSVEQVI